VIDIDQSFLDRLRDFLRPRSSDESGQVEHALGDDFATIEFGKGEQLARDCDRDRAGKIRSVPSAQ
jgi:hypothetical protein